MKWTYNEQLYTTWNLKGQKPQQVITVFHTYYNLFSRGLMPRSVIQGFITGKPIISIPFYSVGIFNEKLRGSHVTSVD